MREELADFKKALAEWKQAIIASERERIAEWLETSPREYGSASSSPDLIALWRDQSLALASAIRKGEHVAAGEEASG